MKRILTNLDLGNNEILNVKNIYTKEEAEQKFVDQTKLDTSAFEIGPDGKIIVKNDSHTHTIDNITGLQNALDSKVSTDQLGAPSGIATLDETGKVLSSQLPSYVDSVIEGYYDDATGKFYEDSAKTVEITGGSGKIYVDLPTSKQYRWGGTQFIEIASGGVTLGETANTAYRGDLGKIAYEHSKLVTGNPHKVTKADIGLDKVDNTADTDKPISTATQTALDLKLDKLNAVTGVKGSAEDVVRTGEVVISKENIGLDFVENKSSTMIRSEITSQNIVDALGYTPVDPKDVPAEVTPFTGATADADGSTGTVTQPKQGDQAKFLKGDGTWSDVPSYTAAGDELGLVKSGGDAAIVDGIISVNDNSHNHTIENVTGLQDALDKKISAEDGKGLSVNDLTDALKASYDKAVADSHTHENKTVLDSIDADKITAWDKAATDDHVHDNKSELDRITTEKITNWDSAVDKAHEHENKEVLDGISADKITEYDKAVTDDHTHDNKEALDTITDTKLEGYDKAVTDSHTHENKVVLDGITDENVTNWNDAATKSHEHENKEVLDGITTEKITAYDKAATDDHTHENILTLNKITEEKLIGYDMAAADHHLHLNKTILDVIEDTNVTAWNGAVTKSHEHENKTALDSITEEKITKWDAGGSSYTAGDGIAISDDSTISTDFKNVTNADTLTGSTKLVTSDSTVGTLSDIGAVIKEDKSLVTLDELNAKLQKTGSSITFGKMFVTNDYDGISESKEPYSDFTEIKKCTNLFPYRDDYNDMTLYWKDGLYAGTMTNTSMYLYYSNNLSTANRATGSFNVNPMKSGITLTVTKTVLPHYDSAGNLSMFACGYTADAKLLLCGMYVCPSRSGSGSLSFMPVRITISDSSWTKNTIADIAKTFECNFSELNGVDPYKLFLSFQYKVGETTVKKSVIYEKNTYSIWSVDLEYNNATGAFTGNEAQYIKTQVVSNIKTSTVGYYPPVKFKDVYVMGRRNTYNAYGTPIMVSHDNCKTWESTTYSIDPPAEYASISISSTASSLWDETVQCNGQVSCVDDTIITTRVNGYLVYSEDGVNWHAGYFGYNTATDDAESDTITYISGAYISEGTIITKSNDNTFILAESQDINRFVYNYGVFSNGSSYDRRLCYSSDGKVFRYARYQKADGTIINGATNSRAFGCNMYGPGKVGDVLFARLNCPGSDLIENDNNANKNYFPIYSEDGGKHWKLGKMFNAVGEDVTETDTTDYGLGSYQFSSVGDKAFMYNSGSMTAYHWYSSDGINWHPITINTTDNQCSISNIVYLNGLYIAIKAADSQYSDILWSEDGVTFTSGTVDAEHSTFSSTPSNPTSLRNYNFSQDVRYVNNKYIVCITSGYAISDDGKTWIVTQKYSGGNGYLPGFMGPVYRDGKYIFGCNDSSQAASTMLFVTPDLINYTMYSAPVENDAQYLNNTPMLIEGKVAMWSSSASSGIGCIENTSGEFDFSPASIRMGEDFTLFSYALLYGGLRGDAKLRYFALSDNQDASTKTQYPYALYQSSDGDSFTVTKLTTEKCPYNLFNCYPGHTGHIVYGNYYILENSGSGDSHNSFTENFCGASHGKYGGIIVDNSGKFIGVSYKQKDSYTSAEFYSWSTLDAIGQPFAQAGIIQYCSYSQYIYVVTITNDGYKSSKYYSLNDDQYNSLSPGDILDFYMPEDCSYCVYLTAKGIYYKDFVKNTTTKATVTDKNKTDVTNENVGYKFIAMDKNVLFVLGTPTTVATENQYLVSSTDIMGDDNSRVLNDAKAYTDTVIANAHTSPNLENLRYPIFESNDGDTNAGSGTFTTPRDCYVQCKIFEYTGSDKPSLAYVNLNANNVEVCSVNNAGVMTCKMGNIVKLPANAEVIYEYMPGTDQKIGIYIDCQN